MTKRSNPGLAGFGARLAVLRRNVGLTQQQLADQVGVSRRVIAYYERETEHPPAAMLPQLATVLRIGVEDLLVKARSIAPCEQPREDAGQSQDVACKYLGCDSMTPVASVREVYSNHDIRVLEGDARSALTQFADDTFQCCVTSPPYWGLRDYGIVGQVGAEEDLRHYIADLVTVFRQVRRTLRKDGTLWLNIGDSYTSGDRRWRAPDKKNQGRAMSYRPPTPQGLKPKDLIGVPWRIALALQADGWYLRSDIVWNKPNCQPESVKDRPTRAHEFIFLLSKSEDYSYDHEAIQEPAVLGQTRKNRRSVWNINTSGFHGAHFAVFPPELVRLCMLAGAPPGTTVLDPFFGSGTVGLVCQEYHRKCVGIELNPQYVQMALARIEKAQPTLPLYSVTNSQHA